jgi:hypothetical protein
MVGLLLAFASGCGNADDGSAGGASKSNMTSSSADSPAPVTEAAAALKLGAYKGSDMSPDVVSTYKFELADVTFNHFHEQVESVHYHDGNVTLDGDVIKAALQFQVGAFQSAQGAAGTQYFGFELATIGFSNYDQKLASIDLRGKDGQSTTFAFDLARPVVALELGKFLNVNSAAGSSYYAFERGVAQYSEVTHSLSKVTVKDASVVADTPEIVVPQSVLDAVIKLPIGRLVGVKTVHESVVYSFKWGTITLGEHDAVDVQQATSQ